MREIKKKDLIEYLLNEIDCLEPKDYYYEYYYNSLLQEEYLYNKDFITVIHEIFLKIKNKIVNYSILINNLIKQNINKFYQNEEEENDEKIIVNNEEDEEEYDEEEHNEEEHNEEENNEEDNNEEDNNEEEFNEEEHNETIIDEKEDDEEESINYEEENEEKINRRIFKQIFIEKISNIEIDIIKNFMDKELFSYNRETIEKSLKRHIIYKYKSNNESCKIS